MNARDALDARAYRALTAFLESNGNDNWPRCMRCHRPVAEFRVQSLPLPEGGHAMVADCHGARQEIKVGPGVLAQLFRELERFALEPAVGRVCYLLSAFTPHPQVTHAARLDYFREALAVHAESPTMTIHFETSTSYL